MKHERNKQGLAKTGRTGFFTLVVICFLLFSAWNAYAEDDYSKGPLYGKNLYIPFLIHYNFPSLPAKSGERYDLQYHFSLYYVQDFRHNMTSEFIEQWTERIYDKQYISRDYESFASELGVAYNFKKNLQTGIDLRMISYYGGFMDSFMEGFHNFFKFPNGGREYFLQKQIYVYIPNENGITMFLDKPAISIGDIDIWGKWTFFENPRQSLAALAAFKLPTGSLANLSGSDYPDAAFGLLMDFRAFRYCAFYTQAGVVLPFNGKSRPMFNGLLGLEVHPWEILSFILQMNIKTSPITDHTIGFGWNSAWGTDFKQYSLPQTNLLAGLVIKYKKLQWQFYFEEDTITNQGVDITFNVMFLHTLSLKKK
jgi:hypothetical protein